jgi:hypothetical protein
VVHSTVTVADPAGYGDSAATLLVGDLYLWVTLAMHGGEDHLHGGPCGQRPTSNNEGHLQGYAHDGFDDGVSPDVDHTWIVTDGPEDQRSTTFEGVSHGDGALWVSGNTTAEPGTGYCGDKTTKDYDDENNAVVYRVVPVLF